MSSIPFVTAIENESADCTTADLVDLTVYGGSAPNRNTLALFLYLYKRDAQDNDTPITVDNTTPLTVGTWSFSLAPPDGWYVGILFGFPLWAAGTYTMNNCVHYSDGNYYQCAVASTTSVPGTDSDWTLITDILGTVLNLSNSNVYITQTNNFTTCKAEIPVGDQLQALSQKIVQGKCKNWEDAAKALYGAALIQGAIINFRRLTLEDAQNVIDFVDNQWLALPQ